MVPARRKQSHPTLERVRELFDRWRRDKGRREPIPDTLWKAAVSLTEAHSVNQVARYLHLSHKDLKARARSPEGHSRQFTFIELNPVTVTIECTVEMEKPTGERMRIRGACNVVELAREFWKA